MPEQPRFSRHLIIAAAMMCGILLALAVHVFGQGFGLDLGGLWRQDALVVPIGAAAAWWLTAIAAFFGGFITASLMEDAATGQTSRTRWQFLIGVLVLVLAAAGNAASAPSTIPTTSGVIAGLLALVLGATMAFCGAHFATRNVRQQT